MCGAWSINAVEELLMEKGNYAVVMTTVPGAPAKTEHGDKKVGDVISEGLLQQKLAACVSTVGPISSRYWWEGKLENNVEFVLMIKTKSSLSPDVQQFIKEHHPYKVPEIITFDISDGNEDYLTWIGACCRYSPRAHKDDTDLNK